MDLPPKSSIYRHVVGLMCSILLFYLYGASPLEHLPYYLIALFTFFYILKIIHHHKERSEQEVFNLCYIYWLLFIYFWIIEEGKGNMELIYTLWGIGFGHGGFAVYQFRNTFVFHREDMFTSLLVHGGLMYFFFPFRWSSAPNTHIFHQWHILPPLSLQGFWGYISPILIFLLIWTILYQLLLCFLKDRIKKSGKMSIGGWYYKHARWYFIRIILLKTPKPYFNIVWGGIYFLIVIFHAFIAYFFLHFYYLAFAFVIFQLLCQVYYSGIYYTYIYPRKFMKTSSSDVTKRNKQTELGDKNMGL